MFILDAGGLSSIAPGHTCMPSCTPKLGNCAQGLQTNRDSRVLWVKDDYILTTGFNQHRQQEVKLWDTRSLNSSLSSVSLGTSNGYEHRVVAFSGSPHLCLVTPTQPPRLPTPEETHEHYPRPRTVLAPRSRDTTHPAPPTPQRLALPTLAGLGRPGYTPNGSCRAGVEAIALRVCPYGLCIRKQQAHGAVPSFVAEVPDPGPRPTGLQ
ncbi:hypothetical protein P4O66_000669 [Electrophorus voltai]|uniref:Uncharacterized protein n=1 Tax=Electrophorus voltai TaxID=2609070 RepID=A0AAD8ZFP6_9TELE|nr:hypothetical protein P4O66_000669 [Electrophorus voltai]